MLQDCVNKLQRVSLGESDVDGYLFGHVVLYLSDWEERLGPLLEEGFRLVGCDLGDAGLLSLVKHIVLIIDMVFVEIEVLLVSSLVELLDNCWELLVIGLRFSEEVRVLLLDLDCVEGFLVLEFADWKFNRLVISNRSNASSEHFVFVFILLRAYFFIFGACFRHWRNLLSWSLSIGLNLLLSWCNCWVLNRRFSHHLWVYSLCAISVCVCIISLKGLFWIFNLNFSDISLRILTYISILSAFCHGLSHKSNIVRLHLGKSTLSHLHVAISLSGASSSLGHLLDGPDDGLILVIEPESHLGLRVPHG